MAITQAGPKCDVCGKFILPIDPEERVNHFKVHGIDKMLHCDNACKKILQKALKANDWKKLPDGPLRKAFEEHEKKYKKG